MALEEILAHKRTEVADRKAAASFESVLARCEPSRRSLHAALRAGRPGFLLEIKFAAPSAGTIRHGADLQPLIESYGRHADAISVLTDTRFFGGSLQRLAALREHLTQPLLCKDFILEPYQVAEARAAGADAILLILAAVTDDTWRHCAALAARLGLEVVTEVHDEAETARALALGAAIIGVNNRNLTTLAVDLATTARLAPLIPPDRLVISESGISSRPEVVDLRPYADAFLVGTALMRETDLDGAVRRLVYGRTKICGLTRPEQAAAALDAGATHGGLVFAPGSPRRLTGPEAAIVRREVPLEWVGVFSDHPPAEVAELACGLAFSAVQLHGQETPEQVADVRSRVPPGCEVWKAVRVTASIPPRAETGADRLLLDAGTAGNFGGSGEAFDWARLEEYPERRDVVLAGGINAANVERAAGYAPWAVDLSSGVESAPGVKDRELMQRFFAVRRRIAGRGDRIS